MKSGTDAVLPTKDEIELLIVVAVVDLKSVQCH